MISRAKANIPPGDDLGPDLSVIVPAYNEQYRLPKMMKETIDFLESRETIKHNIYKTSKFSYEVIIVDDGSSDNTSQVGFDFAKKVGENKIKVITLAQNRGKGGAVREGVLASKGKFVIFADADGASKFSDIEKLEEFMNKQDSQLMVAIGSRAHMEEEAIATRSLFRTILMKGFHLLVWGLCVRTVRDTQCGFKMFNREAANILFRSYHNESWAFDVELLYLAERLKCSIGEIAINWHEVDGSKIVPVISWIRMGYDVLTIFLLYTIGYYQTPERKKVNTD